MTRRALALGLVALASCKRGPEHPEIELVLGLAGEAPIGFRCVGPDGPLMSVANICTGNRCSYALMIDIVDMGPATGEAPSCRPLELRGWCHDPARGCVVLDAARVCRDVEFAVSDAVDQCERLIDGIANVEHPLVVANPPDRLVQIRAVAMRGTCASHGYDPTSLEPPSDFPSHTQLYQGDVLGCAQSCPVVLDNWVGPLTLDIETGMDACTLDNVRKCALGELDPIRPPVCDPADTD